MITFSSAGEKVPNTKVKPKSQTQQVSPDGMSSPVSAYYDWFIYICIVMVHGFSPMGPGNFRYYDVYNLCRSFILGEGFASNERFQIEVPRSKV